MLGWCSSALAKWMHSSDPIRTDDPALRSSRTGCSSNWRRKRCTGRQRKPQSHRSQNRPLWACAGGQRCVSRPSLAQSALGLALQLGRPPRVAAAGHGRLQQLRRHVRREFDIVRLPPVCGGKGGRGWHICMGLVDRTAQLNAEMWQASAQALQAAASLLAEPSSLMWCEGASAGVPGCYRAALCPCPGHDAPGGFVRHSSAKAHQATSELVP